MADGWCVVAQNGSHKQFKHPVKQGSVTVRVRWLSDDLTPGPKKISYGQVSRHKIAGGDRISKYSA